MEPETTLRQDWIQRQCLGRNGSRDIALAGVDPETALKQEKIQMQHLGRSKFRFQRQLLVKSGSQRQQRGRSRSRNCAYRLA